jgi:hypothetical protein|tara:strand:+ start:5664 stop:7286 length:1623 start_codon:yes stop_codon:yes gene_type:complete
MNLDIISSQLRENRSAQEDTTHEVKMLTSLVRKQILQDQRDRMDALDKEDAVQQKTATRIQNESGGGGGLPPLIGNLLSFLRGLAGPLGLVAIAELTDTDAYLRALGLPRLLKGTKNVLSGIANIFDSVRNFKLPKVDFKFADGKIIPLKFPQLPKISFATFAGKIINADNPLKFKIPKFPKVSFADSLGKIFNAGEPIKFKLPELKLPEFKIPELKINDESFKILDKVKAIIGTTAEGAEGGKGLLGFFGRVFKLLDPVLKPLKFVLKTALRPFTQIILTVVDFVKGFYDGFTGEEGDLSDKVLAGLEGGFLGVVKGITEAFDLLFINIPAWLLEKMGFTNVAEVLRGFSLTDLVDPVWNGIKGIVSFVGDQFMNMKDIIVGAFTIELTKIVNGFKNAFTKLSTFIQNLGDELYIMLSKSLQFNFPGIVGKVPDFLPDFMGGGKEIQIMPGFSLGVGNEATRAAAAERIDYRTARATARVNERNREVADMMKAQQDRLAELRDAFQNQVVNAVNNSTNTVNNTQNTVLNAPQMPDPLMP